MMTYLLVRLCYYAIIVMLLSGTVAILCGLSLLAQGWQPSGGFFKPYPISLSTPPEPKPSDPILRRNDKGFVIDEHGEPIDGTWIEQPIPLVQPKPNCPPEIDAWFRCLDDPKPERMQVGAQEYVCAELHANDDVQSLGIIETGESKMLTIRLGRPR